MKNAKIWLKGGVYAILLFGILTLALIPFKEMCDSHYFVCISYWKLPTLPGLGLAMLIETLGIDFGAKPNFVFLIIFSILAYFIIGALIGLIIGKIKQNRARI